MNAPLPLRRLHVDIASGDTLDVRQFRVTARMSALFEAEVVAVSENPDIDFETVVGQGASFTLRWGAGLVRTFTGIARTFEQVAAEEGGLSTYRLTLVPALWLTTQRRNYRIFQQMSEVDIVLQVLGQWGISPVLKLSGRYKKREYRVQYDETDFAFFCRMLEDVGISFYFDPEADSTLVLADEPQSGVERAPLAFRDHPTVADHEHATSMHIGRDVRPGQYAVGDHDYGRPPAFKLLAAARGGSAIEASLESYHYAPGAFSFEGDKGKYRTDEAEGAALAQKRLEATRATACSVTFETNTYDLGPGTVVSFLDHPLRSLAPGKRYLVIASEMRGTVNEAWSHACRAASADFAYRPEQSTPRPYARGVENATIVGPPGEEIHTDELGRVRVQFHWDREGKMDDGSSCWIHVSQPWSGTGFGAIYLPRVGQEVIVDFLGGDPDRPIITGRVYTGLQKTPYKLPEHKTQSGWKSSSTGQTGGYSEIMFEDLAGKELVRVQAERDWTKLVKHDEDAVVGHDRSRLVRHDEKLTVQHDRAVSVGHDETTTIGNDELRTTGNDRTATIGHDESTTIGHDRTKLVQMNESETVGFNRARFVGANESVQIGQNQSTSIGNNESLNVGENQSVHVGGAQSVHIGGAQSLKVGKMSTETVALVKALSVGLAYQITVGGAMNTTVTGMSTEQVGRTKHINVGVKTEIVCGKAKLTLENSGKITLEGTELVFAVDGPMTFHGKEIKVNGTAITIEASGEAQIKGAIVHVTGEPIKLNCKPEQQE
jgi:type VI secretion system secreted protein VgrG